MLAFELRRHLSLPLLFVLVSACSNIGSEAHELPVAQVPGDGSHAALVDFFSEWREFEAPDFDGQVPDYSPASMARQAGELPMWMARLSAFDIGQWTISEKIDWHIMRAEMNGLSFDHAVRQPWSRDPAFYVTIYAAQSDVPAHEDHERADATSGACGHQPRHPGSKARIGSPSGAQQVADAVARRQAPAEDQEKALEERVMAAPGSHAEAAHRSADQDAMLLGFKKSSSADSSDGVYPRARVEVRAARRAAPRGASCDAPRRAP